MLWSLLNNWLFLAIVSSLATAVLIRAGAEALGDVDGAVLMAVRVIAIGIIAIPLAAYIIITKTGYNQFLSKAGNAWPLLLAVAVSGVVSWYAFYLSIDSAKVAGHSDAAVTAINYTSVAGILAILVFQGKYEANWKNWLGVAFVVIGAYLTSNRT